MSDVEWLVTAFKALREGDGVTPDKLADYGEDGRLLQLLGTPGDEDAGLQVLDQLIGRMPDRSSAWDTPDGRTRMQRKKRFISRAVRVALAIGEDDEGRPLKSYGILRERRDWACGKDAPDPKATFYFMKADARTHVRYEDDGFLILARLVVTGVENPSFIEAADHELAGANQVAAFTPADCVDVEGGLSDARRLVEELAESEPSLIDEGSIDHADIAKTVEPTDQAPAGLRTLVRAVFADIAALNAELRVIFRRLSNATATLDNPRPTTRSRRGWMITIIIAVIGASVTIYGFVSGRFDGTTSWGPDRKTFTTKAPAPYLVFNSITDSPTAGDERHFLRCLDLTAHDRTFGGSVNAVNGHTYQCRLYFHNDIAPAYATLPNGGENPLSLLRNARASISTPINGGGPLTAYLSADNADPSAVWDSCDFHGSSNFTLTYIRGSARLFADTLPKDGVPLKDDAGFAPDPSPKHSGALLGDNQDGNLDQNVGYIEFNITARTP